MGKDIQTMVDHWLKLLICSVFVLNIAKVESSSWVNLALLDNAKSIGAVCLDGSPPAYAYDKGYESGANSWIIYLEGGGWCNSTSDCVGRSKGQYGSSSKKGNKIYMSGILSDDQTFNPDFYNWNRVFVTYCDGASFMADIEEVDPANKLTFRGARIFDAVMEDLLDKGMKDAENAILSGGSAGGLATILHCDKFRGLIPNAKRLKCISDSGFFLHAAQKVPGDLYREKRYDDVVATHALDKNLPTSCTSKMNPGLCLFPENLVGDIQTPLFILESGFDKWQIEENVIPAIGGKKEWNDCITNFTLCTSSQLQIMKDFRTTFIETLQKVLGKSPNRGMFVHSCYVHGHIAMKPGWTCSSVIGNNMLANKTIGMAISDWYFDKSIFQEIDLQSDLPKNCTTTLSSDEVNKKCAASVHA